MPRKPESPWIYLFIGLGCIGLAVAVVASTVDNTIKGWSSRTWPKTRGTVVRSWVEEWQSDKGGGRSFVLGAIYRYEVAGKHYENNNVKFSKQLEAGDRARGEEQLAKLAPSGGTCVVYYDPKDPARSCLVPGATLFYLIVLPFLVLLFFFIGVICTWGSARRILAGEKSAVGVRACPAQ